MTELTKGLARPTLSAIWATLRREVIAGGTVALVALPVCLAAGLLVFGQLGSAFLGQGAVSGIYGAVLAGVVAASCATSSFIVTAPLASIAIIPAALVTYLVQDETFAKEPRLVIVALSLCALLTGVLQVLFGLLNVGRIIKFTPHPVIAGFINSVAVLIILGQLRSFFKLGEADNGQWLSVERPMMLAFVLGIAVFMIAFVNLTKKIPASVAGLAAGMAVYYFAPVLFPTINLGPTIGTMPVAFPPPSPLFEMQSGEIRAAILPVASHLLLVSLVLATVATLQSLLAYRVAQNLANLPPRPPPRDLIAQGLGNCASAFAGGLVSLAAAILLVTAYRAGARTRIAPIVCALLIFLVLLFLSRALAAIPVAVLSGILIAAAYQLFDRWSLQLFGDAVRRHLGIDRRAVLQNLSVVLLVMLVSVMSSIVMGVLAGVALSCLIFIARMSRPIVANRYRGDEVFSKRSRPADDMAILRRTGARRVGLELQGVLFFGNADDLSRLVNELLPECDMILLNMRGISDIDTTGATILGGVMARCRQSGKKLVLCHVPKVGLGAPIFVDAAAATLPDLDTALEWMEEEALRTGAQARPRSEPISFAAHDLVKGLDAGEIAVLGSLLTPRDFPARAVMCTEGEEADRMWILTKGSVSVRLSLHDSHDPRRIASMSAGTTVGEMALLEGGRRAATVVCDEEVSTYELTRETFDNVLRSHPQIARKLLMYFAQEMSQRLRVLHQDLRTFGV
ncbi:MAG: SulP family inorganic anion transporter [Xanthobacteraceae bacterium]